MYLILRAILFPVTLSLDSHGTNRAGVIVCLCPDSSGVAVCVLLMGGSGCQCSASDVKSANVNLQKEGMYKRTLDVTLFFFFLSFI